MSLQLRQCEPLRLFIAILSAGFQSLQAVVVSQALLARLVSGGGNPVPGSGLTTTARKTEDQERRR